MFLQSPCLSRRHFLALSLFALPGSDRSMAALLHHCERLDSQGRHPEPRPGINAERVASEAELQDAPDAIDAFNQVRQIPQIIDGIRCNCGCADRKGFYSLLSCFEGPDAMAKYCDKCQGEGRYAFRLHRSGKSLIEIRAALDARFG